MIGSCTGSQWRLLSSGVMWSSRLVRVTRRAVVFWIRCKCWISSDKGMHQLFSDRLSQKMTNLSNVSDVQRSSTANGTDMFVKGQTAVLCHSKTLHILCRNNVYSTNLQLVSENVWTEIQPCMCRGPLSSPHFVLVFFFYHSYIYVCKLPVATWMFSRLWARKKCTILCRLHTCDNLVLDLIT